MSGFGIASEKVPTYEAESELASSAGAEDSSGAGKAAPGCRPANEANAADGALPPLDRREAMRQESRKPLAGE